MVAVFHLDHEEIIIIFAYYDNNTQINMAENKKEMERAELHRTIWAIADDMRGAVDGWDFKAYYSVCSSIVI